MKGFISRGPVVDSREGGLPAAGERGVFSWVEWVRQVKHHGRLVAIVDQGTDTAIAPYLFGKALAIGDMKTAALEKADSSS